MNEDASSFEEPYPQPTYLASDPSWYTEAATTAVSTESQDFCCSCGPVEMAPGTSIAWATPITVSLEGELVTLGAPNVDLDGDGRLETFTGQDGSSIVMVTDANGDGTGESIAVYNSAGQLTSSLVLDATTGQWQPVVAEAFAPTVGDPAFAPGYTVVGPDAVGTEPTTDPSYLVVAPDPAAPTETVVTGAPDYSGNPSMVLFDSAAQLSQRTAADLWAMAYGPEQPVPSDNPAVLFAQLSLDHGIDPQIRDLAEKWSDLMTQQTHAIIESM